MSGTAENTITGRNSCELEGFRIECGGGIQNHHLLNRGKLYRVFKKNKAAKKYVEETYQNIFICGVCASHNAATKMADWKVSRKKLLIGKRDVFGITYTQEVLDGFQKFLKVPEPMWTYKGIMSIPFPK